MKDILTTKQIDEEKEKIKFDIATSNFVGKVTRLRRRLSVLSDLRKYAAFIEQLQEENKKLKESREKHFTKELELDRKCHILEAKLHVDRWRDVTKELPEPGIYWCKSNKEWCLGIVSGSDKNLYPTTPLEDEYDRITHWKPITPPKTETGE